jgi:AraC-like DNA-binding protein
MRGNAAVTPTVWADRELSAAPTNHAIVETMAPVHRLGMEAVCVLSAMSLSTEQRNRRMLRARDRMDRTFAEPLDIPALAKVAGCSDAHFIRTFREVFGETPHRYLQRRRVERAMHLLREGRSVTDVCFDVGFNSLGTFSRTFSAIVGVAPALYRRRAPDAAVPTCFAMSWTRPSSFGEARKRRA